VVRATSAGDDQQQGQQQAAEFPRHDAEIELHADGDEEQSEQHVAKGADIRFDLVAVHGFREQHAADEGAECQRQSCLAGGKGQSNHDP
jgi:hypothetical protein